MKKTGEYYLNFIQWQTHQIRSEKSIAKVTFKILNNQKNNQHRFDVMLTNKIKWIYLCLL